MQKIALPESVRKDMIILGSHSFASQKFKRRLERLVVTFAAKITHVRAVAITFLFFIFPREQFLLRFFTPA